MKADQWPPLPVVQAAESENLRCQKLTQARPLGAYLSRPGMHQAGAAMSVENDISAEKAPGHGGDAEVLGIQ